MSVQSQPTFQVLHVVSPTQVIRQTALAWWMMIWELPPGSKVLLGPLVVLGVIFGNFAVSPAIRRKRKFAGFETAAARATIAETPLKALPEGRAHWITEKAQPRL